MATVRPQAPLALADRFWLLAHDCFKWTPRLAEPAMGIGLAAALLGEQILFENCAIVDKNIRWYRTPRMADSLCQGVASRLYAAQLEADRSISIAEGLDLLSQDAYIDVADRLRRFGIVQRVRSRRLFRTEVHYSVVDRRAAMGPQAYLESVLFAGPIPRIDDQFIGVLVWATYLTSDVFPDERDAPNILNRYRRNMPNPFGPIAAFAQAGIDAAVASRGGHGG